ncbi:Integrin beta-2, partial [Geodia barretti]
MRTTLVIAVAFLATGAVSQNADVTKLCEAQTSCRDCIQASPQCSWCSEFARLHASPGPRCKIRTGQSPLSSDCTLSGLEDPKSRDPQLTQASFNALNQISPLRANIVLRTNDPKSFQLTVRPSNNYPIDLYLLMDLSNSMRDDLEKLKTLGAQLSERI